MPFQDPILVSYRQYDVIIIGGGLAGLCSAIELSRAGHQVLVIEKKQYPFHKVCGEYVSKEVLPYLHSLGFDPFALGAANIDRLRISTPSGKNIHAPLDTGGFGLSRYRMDDALQQLACKYGCHMLTQSRVVDVHFQNDFFYVQCANGQIFQSILVIGAWGKRDTLDKRLNRDFINEHTGYLGVKYHIRTDYPVNEIGLDNFPGGYCGISKIEDDLYNMCYLYQRDYAPRFKTIRALEEAMLFQNPVLKHRFKNAEFVFDEPEVINEISFSAKQQVSQHVLLCGDTGGLITPLCGNGMSMAISAAKILSELILTSGILSAVRRDPGTQFKLEQSYQKAWTAQFGRRLFWGRTIQRIFGAPQLSEITILGIHAIPALERWLIRQTHGATIKV